MPGCLLMLLPPTPPPPAAQSSIICISMPHVWQAGRQSCRNESKWGPSCESSGLSWALAMATATKQQLNILYLIITDYYSGIVHSLVNHHRVAYIGNEVDPVPNSIAHKPAKRSHSNFLLHKAAQVNTKIAELSQEQPQKPRIIRRSKLITGTHTLATKIS